MMNCQIKIAVQIMGNGIKGLISCKTSTFLSWNVDLRIISVLETEFLTCVYVYVLRRFRLTLRSSSVVVARDSYPLGQWFNPTLRNKKLITSWGML